MSKMRDIEDTIYLVLSDDTWHYIDEMRQEIIKKDKSLLDNDNYLSVILYKLKEKTKSIINDVNRKGWYRMNNIEKKNDEVMPKSDTYRNLILNDWKKFYISTRRCAEANYEMTDEQFKEGKWFYKLNQEIEKLIKTFEVEE